MKKSNIGGIFSLPKTKLLTTNARSALYILNKTLQPKTVWLPDFHCPILLEIFKNHRFYKVDNKLNVDFSFSEVGENDLVLFIDYFGFTYDPTLLETIKNKKAFVVEDATQALLSLHNQSDFVVYSFPKFLPVPDGGIINNLQCPLETPPDYWKLNLSAMEYRQKNENDNKTWYDLSLEAKKHSPIGNYSITDYTKNLLPTFNYYEIAMKRRRNYLYLLENLFNYAVFPFLPAHVVPYGFPICLKDRDIVRQRLFNNKIFPPIHWEINHALSETIMTLPCDQRYDEGDMEFICKQFQK